MRRALAAVAGWMRAWADAVEQRSPAQDAYVQGVADAWAAGGAR